MQPYLDLLENVLTNGKERADRTGTGTVSIFGTQTRYDLRNGFPLVTTKKVLFPAVVRELLWFLKGSTNINEGLKEHTPIWNGWADENGNLGPIYGHQWRAWGANPARRPYTDDQPASDGIDQISSAIALLKKDPFSRRNVVSAWNVTDLPAMKMPPCHALFQFYVHEVDGIDGVKFLDCQLYQRSADLALGVPFNIASYALLTEMIANECGMLAGDFVHTIGDAHIYKNHVDGIKEQLKRDPLPLPEVFIPGGKPVLEVTFEDIELLGYEHHPFIKFDVSV